MTIEYATRRWPVTTRGRPISRISLGLHYLVTAEHQRGDLAAAVHDHRRALTVSEQYLPSDHPYRVATKEGLSAVLADARLRRGAGGAGNQPVGLEPSSRTHGCPRRHYIRGMMLRAPGFLVLGVSFAAATATRAMAQNLFDSVQTARGRCPLWMAPPGTSGQADYAYTRCVLDRNPRLRDKPAMPAEPLDERLVNGSYAVFVNADGTVDPHLTRMWSRSLDTAFHRKALETIHQWRFEPGVRQGSAVRSAFTLELITNARTDTIPA